MTWFKVDDGLPRSRKILSIPRSVRLSAVGLWTLAGAWSAGEELDGHVPDYIVTELGGTPRLVAALVKSGLWEEVEGGKDFYKWPEYQPTRAELEEARAKETERKRRWRERQRPESVPPGQDAGRDPESGHPDPTRPDPTRKETAYAVSQSGSEEGASQVRRREGNPPPTRCAKHENNPTDRPCRPCGVAREAHATWVSIQARNEAESRSAAAKAAAQARTGEIANCSLCGDDGYRDGRPCSHDPDEDARRQRGLAKARAAITKSGAA